MGVGKGKETLQEVKPCCMGSWQRKWRESEESKRRGERRNRQFIPEAEGGHQHDLRVSGSEDERTVARVKT